MKRITYNRAGSRGRSKKMEIQKLIQEHSRDTICLHETKLKVIDKTTIGLKMYTKYQIHHIINFSFNKKITLYFTIIFVV